MSLIIAIALVLVEGCNVKYPSAIEMHAEKNSSTPESEKPWLRGSIAIREVFANPESFCDTA